MEHTGKEKFLNISFSKLVTVSLKQFLNLYGSSTESFLAIWMSQCKFLIMELL